MSHYLRVYSDNVALLLHYQDVLEVGTWVAGARIPREAVWRDENMPVISLARILGRDSDDPRAYVVLDFDDQKLMLLVEQINSLIDVEDQEFREVADRAFASEVPVNEACYRESEDDIYWRLGGTALLEYQRQSASS